jgi:HEAT repeat protein
LIGRPGDLGILTVDAALTIRTWDDWLAAATGIPAADVRGRALADVFPDLAGRGLLARFQQVLATGEVQVLAPAFHHYLVPCPPAAPSPHFDRMQQRVTLGALREDSRIVGVMATIEDVTARLDAEREIAAALRSPDPGVREAAAQKVAGAETLEEPQAFTAALRDENWKVRRAAVEGLSRHAHRDMLAALLNALRDEHHNFNVLSSALSLLATSAVDVTGPLTELLGADDPDLRIQAALALGEQHHLAGIDALIGALADPDPNVRFHAVEALGRLRAADAVDALAAIAEGEDFFLAFPAVDALAQIGDPRAAPRLAPLLSRAELAEPVAEALGDLGGAEVVRPLVEALNANGPAVPIARALAQLHRRYEERYGGGEYVTAEFQGAVRPVGAQRLVDAVSGAPRPDMRALVTILGWLRGPAIERALTRLLGQAAVRSEVIEAVVRQDAGIVDLLVEQLSAEDLETQLAAVAALGRLGDRRATPALVPLLDRDRDVAVAASAALARIGDPAAFEALVPLLGSGDATVRQAAIGALNSLGHPDMASRIVALLQSPDPLLRESAVRIAGYFGYRECVAAVMACCDDPIEGVRRAAIEHLPFLDDPRALPRLEAALRDQAPKVRAVAVQALAQVDRTDARRPLLDATLDRDAWVRYYAARSLGELRDSAAVPRLGELARDDAAMHVRIAALEAVGTIDGATAVDVLLPHAEHEHAELAAAALRGLGRVSDARAAAALLSALRSTDPARRVAAVAGLGLQASPAAVEALEWTAVADADDGVSCAAIDALSALARRTDGGADAAVRALIAITAEPARYDRAVSTLAGLPHHRIPPVAAGLRHGQPGVRRAVIAALSGMQHPDASSGIRVALDDEDAGVREAAVTALDRLGARGIGRKLSAMARDDASLAVRRAAAAALSRQAPDADRMR